ncbi:hypothetical protein ACYZUA_26490 [Pseudomonas sp. LS2P72]
MNIYTFRGYAGIEKEPPNFIFIELPKLRKTIALVKKQQKKYRDRKKSIHIKHKKSL